MGVDPRIAQVIDGRHLAVLLPGIEPADLDVVRRSFAAYLEPLQRRDRYACWQEAWNAWTGATRGSSGTVRYTPRRCAGCNGHGFTTRHTSRNLARTGNPSVCGDCHGTRRGQPRTQPARYAQLPADTDAIR